VAERGLLGRAARAELVATLVGYATLARDLGVARVTLLGTEPIRRAADSAAIVHEVVTAAGAPLHVLSHEEEAYLTIIGVTQGLPVTRETLVVDSGGGSSEFCVVDPVHRPRASGLRVGSARLSDRYVQHDPPTADEVASMRAAAAAAIRDAPDARPAEVIAVGGTASNLLKLLPEALTDGILTRDRIAGIQADLEADAASVISERYGVNPIRARLLAAGSVIVDAILERYGVEWLRVSDSGVREGAILAVDHGGPAWRDQLERLAHGWRT
jgi:exopolyphosphatase/guanosine-5'-triphosphate,3'-diphosphate pyrophosphatase